MSYFPKCSRCGEALSYRGEKCTCPDAKPQRMRCGADTWLPTDHEKECSLCKALIRVEELEAQLKKLEDAPHTPLSHSIVRWNSFPVKYVDLITAQGFDFVGGCHQKVTPVKTLTETDLFAIEIVSTTIRMADTPMPPEVLLRIVTQAYEIAKVMVELRESTSP